MQPVRSAWLETGEAGYNLTQFFLPDGVKNLLDTGKLSSLFEKISEDAAQQQGEGGIFALEKYMMEKLCDSLYQAFSLSGERKKICQEQIKAKIYEYCSKQPLAKKVLDVLDKNIDYKYNPDFKELIARVQYLAKDRFFSNYKHGFVKGTKFSHHLGKIMGNLSGSSTRGFPVFLAGIAGIGIGLGNFYQTTPDQPPNNVVGAYSVIAGTGFTLAPILSAGLSALQDEP